MTKEKNHRSLVLENPLEILIEMMVMMNEDHYQMMTKVRLYYMTKYPNIHHARNDIVDHKDNSPCSDMYDRERFCILDVDLTNVFRDIHEQIDIFRRICKSRFLDMIDIVRFYIVVNLFSYYYLLNVDLFRSMFERRIVMMMMSCVVNSIEQLVLRQLSNTLDLLKSARGH